MVSCVALFCFVVVTYFLGFACSTITMSLEFSSEDVSIISPDAQRLVGHLVDVVRSAFLFAHAHVSSYSPSLSILLRAALFPCLTQGKENWHEAPSGALGRECQRGGSDDA